MKFKRTERIGAIVKILSDNPNKIYTLSFFTEKFNAAKSTISEDLLVVKDVFEKLELGRVITISGAAGGVKYIPKTSIEENKQFLMELCEKINDDSRKLSGGFLYLIDLIYNPAIVAKIGKIFASNLDYSKADYVVTMETKGIPMALMRKALKPDSKVILIDDFMRGGGTLKGMKDLMHEFGAKVIGTGVFISTTKPQQKMVEDYISLIELDDNGETTIAKPNFKRFKDEYRELQF